MVCCSYVTQTLEFANKAVSLHVLKKRLDAEQIRGDSERRGQPRAAFNAAPAQLFDVRGERIYLNCDRPCTASRKRLLG